MAQTKPRISFLTVWAEPNTVFGELLAKSIAMDGIAMLAYSHFRSALNPLSQRICTEVTNPESDSDIGVSDVTLQCLAE